MLERASSFVINFSYRRAIPSNAPRRIWAMMEVACCLRAWLIFLVPLLPQFPLVRILQIYGLALLALGLNHVRTLVAHRYLSTGEKMSFVEQFGDSVNVTGMPLLTELFFPVGLRYHALHHLFPSIPYHNLGIAHRRLMANLPQGSAYHRANYSGFWSALCGLMRNSKLAMTNPPPGADLWYELRRTELVAVAPELDPEEQN
jgi:fatty acid desaturase